MLGDGGRGASRCACLPPLPADVHGLQDQYPFEAGQQEMGPGEFHSALGASCCHGHWNNIPAFQANNSYVITFWQTPVHVLESKWCKYALHSNYSWSCGNYSSNIYYLCIILGNVTTMLYCYRYCELQLPQLEPPVSCSLTSTGALLHPCTAVT